MVQDTLCRKEQIMKKIKIMILVALVCLICISLCACGISKEDAVGLWSGTYVYEGNQFACAFVLTEGGDYYKETFKNGSLSSSEIGTYEVKNGKVILHEDGNMGISTEYKYSGGKLVNNGHKFTKE